MKQHDLPKQLPKQSSKLIRNGLRPNGLKKKDKTAFTLTTFNMEEIKHKTLIAPYSPRKTAEASIATPLYWEEVKEGLRPEQFTLPHMIHRIQTNGCPFSTFFEAGEHQQIVPLQKLISK